MEVCSVALVPKVCGTRLRARFTHLQLRDEPKFMNVPVELLPRAPASLSLSHCTPHCPISWGSLFRSFSQDARALVTSFFRLQDQGRKGPEEKEKHGRLSHPLGTTAPLIREEDSPSLKIFFFFKYCQVTMLVLISTGQQSNAVIHMYILFHIHFHSGLSQDVEYSSLCSAVVACCLPSSLDSFKCLRPL